MIIALALIYSYRLLLHYYGRYGWEVLDLPDRLAPGEQVLVMPLLRPFNSPTFDTFGEAIDCFRQLFQVTRSHPYITSPISTSLQGVQFLHEHHIAHRYVI